MKKGRKRRSSRALAFLLSLVLMMSTFYADYAVAFAAENEVAEETNAPEEVKDETPVEVSQTPENTQPVVEEEEQQEESLAVESQIEESQVAEESAETIEEEETAVETEATEEETEATEETTETEETEESEEVGYHVVYYVDGTVFANQAYTEEENKIHFPQSPFKAGYFFRGWKENGTAISDGSTVDHDMNLTASFEEIKIFEAKVNYYYINPTNGAKVVFDTALTQVEKNNLPATILSPTDTAISAEVDPNNPVYYPTETSVQITEADVANVESTRQEGSVVIGVLRAKEVKFVPYEFKYYVSYQLKDLTGDGYTEIERQEENGISGAVVTPPVKSFPGAVFERMESTTVTTSGQVIPVYYTRANYTLRYDTDGGSYVDAMTAPFETVIALNAKPTWQGYDFDGWYLDPEFQTPAGKSLTLMEDTYVYAKWEPKMVDYTVLYFIENADDTEYSYLTSTVKQARVGDEVTAKASDTTPRALDTKNFTFAESTTETIKADGSSVITVKYSRNEYTLKWNGEIYNTSSKLRASNQGTATLTAKYGAVITQLFNANFNTALNSKYAWNFSKKNDDKFVSCETMPSAHDANVTSNGNIITVYAFDFSTENTQTLRYWLENYESAVATTEKNGKTYGLYNTVIVKFNYLYDKSEFYEINGYNKGFYEAYQSSTETTIIDQVWVEAGHYNWWGRWVDDSHWEYVYDENEVVTPCNYQLGGKTADYSNLRVDFFYNAKTYPLAFYDYNGDEIDTLQIPRNADISGYFTEMKPEAPVEDATWLGWYTEADRINLYAGDYKMPTGLVLYAGWQMPDRQIHFVDPFGEEDVELKTETYSYGEKAEYFRPTDHAGYNFAGWYTDKSYSKQYDFAKPITKETTIYAKWNAKVLSYTVHYLDADTNKPVAEDKVVTSPVLTIGKTVTEKSVTVVGYLPDANEKSTILTFDENEIIFYYEPKEGEISYKVRYLIANHPDVAVAPEVEKTISANFVSVTEAAVPVDKAYLQANHPSYMLNEYYPETDVITQELTSGENIITFIYHPYSTGRAIVRYVDMDGNQIPGTEEVITAGRSGDVVYVSTRVNGYRWHHTEDGDGKIAGNAITLTDGDTYRNVYYQKLLTITANNKTKEYDGLPLRSEGIDDVTVEGLVEGHVLSGISYNGSQTLGGSSDTVPKDAIISGTENAEYYAISYRPGSLTVTRKQITVTIKGDEITHQYDGTAYTATYHVEAISDNSFKPEYIQFNGPTASITRQDAGKDLLILEGQFIVKPQYRDTFDVKFVASNGYVEITRRPLIITTGNKTEVYGTIARSDEYSITGFAPGESASIDYMTGAQEEVGESENTYHMIQWDTAKEGNYEIVEHRMGTLKVTPKNVTVTITGNSDTVNYDGDTHTVTGYTAKADSSLYKVEDGAYFTGPEASASGRTVGTYYMGLKETQFTNTNKNFKVDFVVEDGKLKIVPSEKVTVIITGHQDSKLYSGEEQSVEGYDVEIRTPQNVEGYTENDFTFTGEAVAAGTTVGTYPMGLTKEMFTNTNANYDVDFVVEDGKLTISKPSILVKVSGHKESVKYNRQEQTVEGYDTEITMDGKATNLYTAADFTFSGEAVAAGTIVGTYPMGLTEDQFTNNNENFTVEFQITEDGQLVIDKMPVTVTIKGHTLNVLYDGEEHKVNGYAITGINGTRSAVYTVDDFERPEMDADVATAVRTVAGRTEMALSNADFTNLDENFDVVFDVTPGYVEIKPIESTTVKIKGNTDTQTYTGETIRVEGWVVDGEIDDSIIITLSEDVEAVAEGIEVGTYPMGLTKEAFIATSENFTTIEIEVEDGWLEILALPPTDEPTPPGGGGPTPGGGGGTPTPTPDDIGDVLGAKRGYEAVIDDAGQVLGANRRSPKTSDNNNAILWMMVMGSSALGMAAMMAQKKRKEEE